MDENGAAEACAGWPSVRESILCTVGTLAVADALWEVCVATVPTSFGAGTAITAASKDASALVCVLASALFAEQVCTDPFATTVAGGSPNCKGIAANYSPGRRGAPPNALFDCSGNTRKSTTAVTKDGPESL